MGRAVMNMNLSNDGDGLDARSRRTSARRDDEYLDLANSVRGLSGLTTGHLPLNEMLTKVAEYAVRAIPGAEGAGLTLIADDRSETLVATSQLVSDVDAIQYGIRQGPCITAAAEATIVWSHSLGDDERWPAFGPQVAHLGINSALSLPLTAPKRVIGAMNIYATDKNAFDEHAANLGQLFAVPAALAVQNAEVLSRALAVAAQFRGILTSRATIDQAIGVLMDREKIGAAIAESRLRASSEARGLTIPEVAEITVRGWSDR